MNQITKKTAIAGKDVTTEYGISAKVEHITPEIARTYLTHNTDNPRKLDLKTVEKYASDIKSNLWEVNGEGIVFNKAGELVNGQHRLYAILNANVAADVLVVRGVDDNVRIYDSGKTRSARDALKISGIELPIQATSAARLLVSKFQPIGRNAEIAYISQHEADLRRAYVATCLGGPAKASNKAACVLGSYLMLRTKRAQKHDVESFYNVFNAKRKTALENEEQDVSSALVARTMFDENIKRLQKAQLEIIVCAMSDYVAGKHRELPYEINKSSQLWNELMTEVRKEDGLE